MCPNNSHRHLIVDDAASSYYCPSPITGSNIPKWDCILNFCSDFPGENMTDLESSGHIGRLFPASLHKIKFRIFQQISECLIRLLRTFRYKNTCELCDTIQDKNKRGKIMVKNLFVCHKEVIDVFHNKFYIPTIEKLSFHLSRVRIIGSMECEKIRNDFSR